MLASWTSPRAQIQSVPRYSQCSGISRMRIFFFLAAAPYAIPQPWIRSERQLQPKPQLRRRWILNLLCPAGDGTCVPALPRQRLSPCATLGTPGCGLGAFHWPAGQAAAGALHHEPGGLVSSSGLALALPWVLCKLQGRWGDDLFQPKPDES